MAPSISFQEVTTLAKSGDAEAQYALSSVLHQRGQFDESLRWLHLAAAQKLIQAQMTLATLLIDGRHCSRDLQQAIDLLQSLATTEIGANLLLAELYGFSALGIANRERGLRYLFAAARMGDSSALRQLALLSVCHERWDLTRSLLDAAARRGDAVAMYSLAYCYGNGIGGAADAGLAAAVNSNETMRRLYLGSRLEQDARDRKLSTPVVAVPTVKIDWLLLEQALPQLAADIPLPFAEILHQEPLVQSVPEVIHPLVLDAVINLAAPLVQRSQIIDAGTGERRPDPMRTSSHVTLGPRQHDHVMEAIECCIGRLSGLPVLNGEFAQILRYRIGEEFKPHVDYFNNAGAYQSVAEGGQRAQTVLLYLNDDYSGGSTHFPQLQLNIKGRRGDLLHFHNLRPDGVGDRNSLHAGMPVISGEKWLLSKWIRSENYPPRVAW